MIYPQVPEYLPSVSETTGDYQPGQFIIRLIVSFTLFPCLVDALLYYHQFVTQAPSLLQHKWWYQWLTKINLLMFIIKLFCFYTVTFIGLNENEGTGIKLLLIYTRKRHLSKIHRVLSLIHHSRLSLTSIATSWRHEATTNKSPKKIGIIIILFNLSSKHGYCTI